MLQDPETPIGRASKRRYSAWILYARAFAGNRADADDIVRKAVTRTYQASEDLSSERQAHERVLAAIRNEAMELLHKRTSAAAAAADVPADQSSVFHLLVDRHSKTDPRHAGEVASEMLQELPRPQRRAIEALLLRRPAMPLQDLARKRRMEVDSVAEEIEEGLDLLAASLHAVPESQYVGGHPDLRALTAYVDGALTGEEASGVVAHCGECSECGDRLGTMVLLRSGAAKAALAPRVPRSIKAAAAVVTLFVGLAAGGMLIQALTPNPWAEHATADTVPEWFHDFLYGYREDVSSRDAELAAGLELLVRGDYQAAINRLSPLTETPASRPEASAYLGIAQYLTGDVSRSTVDLLEAGTSSTRAGRISDWYLANALLARGDVEHARRRLNGLAVVGDWVGRQAEGLLEALRQAEQQPDRVVVG